MFGTARPKKKKTIKTTATKRKKKKHEKQTDECIGIQRTREYTHGYR